MKQKIRIYNPLLKDFEFPWLDNHNKEFLISLPSLKTTELSVAQGNFMKKHLGDYIMIDRGLHYSKREEIEAEITK